MASTLGISGAEPFGQVTAGGPGRYVGGMSVPSEGQHF